MTSTHERTRLESGLGAWLDRLDAHALEHGFHARLGARHGALYTEDDDSVLLVSFEDARDIRTNGAAPDLPFGLVAAGKEGWSQLCLYSDGKTWFRDPDVYAFFDDLVDDGFFDLFDRVVFYGAGPCGFAAAAYSVAAPGATVITVRPHATLDPARAIWDRRYPRARRLDFSGRYGDAPKLLEAAERAVVIYDPLIPEDAMHATLYGASVTHFRTTRLGPEPERALREMGALTAILRHAGRGRLDDLELARLYRKRRRYFPYLRDVGTWLEAQRRPLLEGLWYRGAVRQSARERLVRGLEGAEAILEAEGRTLPPLPPHLAPA